MSKNVTVNVTWHSQGDACVKCIILNGVTFYDVDIFQPTLIDPAYGELWDFDANKSLMHGGSGTCRCFLEFTFECHMQELAKDWGEVVSHCFSGM